VFTFPASYCNDRGQRIKQRTELAEFGEGFAKAAYDYFVEHLKLVGYKMRTRLLNFLTVCPATSAYSWLGKAGLAEVS
jgi:hypothetical protein